MYSPTFQTLLADARIDDLRRVRRASIQPNRRPADGSLRSAARWGLLGRERIRRLVFADPSRAN